MPGTLLAGTARLSAGRFASPRVVFVGLVLVLVFMLCRIRMIGEWLSLQDVSVSLAVTAAAIGVCSAICCAVLGQLYDDARGLWLAVGLTVYSVLGIPAATLNAVVSTIGEAYAIAMQGGTMVERSRYLAYCAGIAARGSRVAGALR
jgi:hypothetical protein